MSEKLQKDMTLTLRFEIDGKEELVRVITGRAKISYILYEAGLFDEKIARLFEHSN